MSGIGPDGSPARRRRLKKYDSTEALREEMRKSSSSHASRSRSFAEEEMDDPELIERTFQAYLKANTGDLDIVLGSADIRTDVPLIANFGTLFAKEAAHDAEGITERFRQLFSPGASRSLDFPPEHFSKGSVVADNAWHVYYNDAFIVGAIHASKSFQVSGVPISREPPHISDDRLWLVKERDFRVFGREIAMLAVTGYTPSVYTFADGTSGITFTAPAKPTEMSFSEIIAAAKKMSLQAVKDFLSDTDVYGQYTPPPDPPIVEE